MMVCGSGLGVEGVGIEASGCAFRPRLDSIKILGCEMFGTEPLFHLEKFFGIWPESRAQNVSLFLSLSRSRPYVVLTAMRAPCSRVGGCAISLTFSLSHAHRRNGKRFRGGLVFKAYRLVYHSSLVWRVIRKKKTHRNDGALLEIERVVAEVNRMQLSPQIKHLRKAVSV
jgi:hypothetical protein